MSIYLAVHPIHLSICRRGDDAPTHEWTYKGIELPKNSGRVYARALASTYELILDQRGLKDGFCVLFFLHSHSHNHSDISNVYLLVLAKATG